jgi:hypothetical protein
LREQRVRPPSYRFQVGISLNASARLPEESLRFSIAAHGPYRALLWGLQSLNGGQRQRVKLAYLSGEPELIE